MMTLILCLFYSCSILISSNRRVAYELSPGQGVYSPVVFSFRYTRSCYFSISRLTGNIETAHAHFVDVIRACDAIRTRVSVVSTST